MPFDCLNSSKIICFNAVKQGCFFVKKNTKKHSKTVIFDNLKSWRLAYSKNLRRNLFFVQNFYFSRCFWFFWRRHNLVMRTPSQLWWFFLLLMKQIIQLFSKSWKFKYFFSMWVFFKSPKSFLINYISISKQKEHKFWDFF